MIERLRALWQVPGQFALSLRLLRDPEVPILPKVVAVGAIVLILSPLDIVEWVPGVGGLGGVALLAVVLRSFINAVPDAVRARHMAALGMR